MPELFDRLLNNVYFIFQRLDWLNLVDLILVTLVFWGILLLLRDTQAMVLIRGALLLIVLISLLTSLEVLPAFSWLVRNTLPALVLAIPVIFAPEIRRTLERLGRAGSLVPPGKPASSTLPAIATVVSATSRLSDRKHGALIVMKRTDNLDEYVKTGVKLGASLTPELLLQVFYPNTPLHDGAVVISGERLVAAACVMPLSASGVLTRSPERQMGLRHRAALGISEITDAVAVVVSEETGFISVVHGGRMIRRLDAERLENILMAFYRPLEEKKGLVGMLERLFSRAREASQEEN
ncbi:MAG TPA: diadenylate cyclase CdaA [Anaerolineales bacterium]|nr:diadenylate cyclase CdaA [Anaerolineales bacterium]